MVVMCRALRVLCVARSADELSALKRASVSAEWELAPGATTDEEATKQLDSERPHFLVVFGPFEELVRSARARFPAMRIVTDRKTPGGDVVATSLGEVREAMTSQPRPGGPVRS
jgi:hypothetical protein